MPKPESNLDDLMKNPKAAGLLKNREVLAKLLKSPDTQKLMQLLSQNAGDGLKTAAGAAAKGDTSQLINIVNQVMQSKEGAQVVNRINQSVPTEKK